MRSQTTLSSIAAFALMVAVCSAAAQPRIPPTYHAAPDEVIQLPKYCYAQYVDGALSGEFAFPKSCGPAMNHYCGALVSMMRAQKMSLRKAERVGYMQAAVREINYTIHDMSPGCPVAHDVLATKQRAEMLSRIIK